MNRYWTVYLHISSPCPSFHDECGEVAHCRSALERWKSSRELFWKAEMNCDKINFHIKSIPWNSVILVFLQIKMCLLHQDQCEACLLHLALHRRSLCFHGDSLMASFASLFFVLPPSNPFISAISVWSLLMTIVPHGSPLSSPTLYFSSLTLSSISLPLWKTKWESRV